MIVIKDSMVLIHLAKMAIFADSCRYFGNILIPEKVYEETVLKGKEKGYPDSIIIEQSIKGDLIKIKGVMDKRRVDNLRLFGLHLGEAEAVALYFQEKARYLATDDDTCRRNRIILGINIVGSPAIILTLLRKGLITRQKASDCVSALETIGWFDTDIIHEMQHQIGTG